MKIKPPFSNTSVAMLSGSDIQVATAALVQSEYLTNQPKHHDLATAMSVDMAITYLQIEPLPLTTFINEYQTHLNDSAGYPMWQGWQLFLRGWNRNHFKKELIKPRRSTKQHQYYLIEEVIAVEDHPIFRAVYRPYKRKSIEKSYQFGLEVKIPPLSNAPIKRQGYAFANKTKCPSDTYQGLVIHLLLQRFFRYASQYPLHRLEALKQLALTNVPPYDLVPLKFPPTTQDPPTQRLSTKPDAK